MPRKSGQAKLASIEGINDAINKAVGGNFHNTQAFNFLAGVRTKREELGNHPTDTERKAYNLFARFVGHQLFEYLEQEDARFFSDLAEVMKVFPKGEPLHRDPALYQLLVIKVQSLKTPQRVFTTAELQALLDARGVHCSKRNIRRRAQGVGLLMDTQPGRRRVK